MSSQMLPIINRATLIQEFGLMIAAFEKIENRIGDGIMVENLLALAHVFDMVAGEVGIGINGNRINH